MQRLLDLLNSYYDVMQDFNKMAEKLEAPDILTGDIIIVSTVVYSTKFSLPEIINFQNASYRKI